MMRRDLCLCSLVPQISVKTQIAVMMHAAEQWKPTNTVRLLKLAVPSVQIVYVGAMPPPAPPTFNPDSSYVLYPESNAIELSRENASQFPSPATLVVPDGSWQQARKIAHRYPALGGLPRVQLPQGVTSRYLVRKKQKEGGVCTLEAIAAAIDALEGGGAGESLRQLCDEMVKRVMISRQGRPAPLPTSAN